MWQNHNYVRLLSAQVISLIGTGISSICLALLAYELAGENASMVLSITFAIKILTYIFLAPVFSAISHKFPKRQTLVILDIARALMFAFIPFVTHVWEVYLLMFIINACSAWFTPQFQSILPLIFTNQNQYIKALSLSRLAFDLEQIVSPILTALFLTTMSFRYLFVLDAATFIISAILILFCVFPCTTNLSIKTAPLTFYALSKGIRDYLNKPQLKALWLAYLAVASASAMVLVNTVTYVHEILNGGEQQTALAMMIVGFGSMLIALRLPHWLQTNSPDRFHWIGMMAICGAFTFGMFTPGWIGYTVICLSLGIGMSCIQTTSGLIITQACEGEDTSSYFAAHFSLTHFWWLISYLAAGISVKWFGISYGYLCMGILSCLSIIAYYFAITKR
ncbi:MFS transporter [Moritella sp. 24]|uniref:MFS transporter n=1 Tax=Moritella sp. 24 TaxID=2746230 RepID=UPI001BAAF0D0|nr:MFS transporter [Moritella sp. 24]QUM77540.1 MFS transporter [Moritella sp. 24]